MILKDQVFGICSDKSNIFLSSTTFYFGRNLPFLLWFSFLSIACSPQLTRLVLVEELMLSVVCPCQWPKAGERGLASFQHQGKAGCSNGSPQTHYIGFFYHLLESPFAVTSWGLQDGGGVEGQVDFKVQQHKRLPSGRGILEETTFLPCPWCCQ